MPKMKTHSGAKKRFKVSGTGKLIHRGAGKRHLNVHKSSTRKRRLNVDQTLETKGDIKTVQKLLGTYQGR